MKLKIKITLTTIVIAGLGAWFQIAILSTPKTPSSTATAASSRSLSPGMTVHIDPVTHEFVEPPADTERLERANLNVVDPMNTSAEGLVEIPSPVPGGGTMIDLQGRFQNTSVATIDEDGTLSVPCLPIRPEAFERPVPASAGEGSEGK